MAIDGLIWMSIGFMIGVMAGVGVAALVAWIDKEAEEEEE